MSPFDPPQSRLEENIQETAAEVVQAIESLTAETVDIDETLIPKLSEIADGIEGLAVLMDGVETLMAGLQATLVSIDGRLATVVTKLGGGLPSALNSDRLRVTGIL